MQVNVIATLTLACASRATSKQASLIVCISNAMLGPKYLMTLGFAHLFVEMN